MTMDTLLHTLQSSLFIALPAWRDTMLHTGAQSMDASSPKQHSQHVAASLL